MVAQIFATNTEIVLMGSVIATQVGLGKTVLSKFALITATITESAGIGDVSATQVGKESIAQ